MNRFTFLILITSAGFFTGEAFSQKQGQAIIDSLYPLLTKAKEDTNKVKLYEGLAATYYAINPDSGLKYASLQLSLAEKLKWETGIAWANNNLGVNYWARGDNALAIEYYGKAQQLGEKLKDRRLVASAIGNIGGIYYDQGDYTRSLEMDLKVIKIFEEMGDHAAVARNMSNVAGTYLKLGNQSKAIEYYSEAYSINKRLDRKLSMAHNVNGLAGIYQKKGDQKKAIEYYFEGLKLNKLVNSKSGMAVSYSSLGYMFLSFAKSKNDTILHRYTSSGKTNLLDNASLYIDSSIEINEAIGNLAGLINNYSTKSEIWELTGDYKEALNTYKSFKQISDSLYNQEKDKKVTEKLMQYEFDRKQAIAALALERQQARARLIRNIQFAAIGLFLIVAIFLFWNNRQKQKAKAKIEKAYAELKSTQTQLIQSEKMASLGELTAGIAHEIQNPLNFVNNFSEVSKELLDEMKEAIEKGDTEDAKEIMNDVIQNLEKINHHGKRADAIVKGMLQHSRSSSGTKELTDINALCDEYLRLAYHGLRAKDKSFNATMKTDFDESIGNINIIPQDIGRVILNLITNAFYVVNEKSNQNIDGYEPIVSVSSKKINGKVEITVTDNGNGIPSSIKEKIFQPFFTTKPTGQGTGLGLSLSYDIVKAHGGELKVETKEGNGSVFTIQLPVV